MCRHATAAAPHRHHLPCPHAAPRRPHLPNRHKGALQVDVIEAKNLPRMDTVGTSARLLPWFVFAVCALHSLCQVCISWPWTQWAPASLTADAESCLLNDSPHACRVHAHQAPLDTMCSTALPLGHGCRAAAVRADGALHSPRLELRGAAPAPPCPQLTPSSRCSRSSTPRSQSRCVPLVAPITSCTLGQFLVVAPGCKVPCLFVLGRRGCGWDLDARRAARAAACRQGCRWPAVQAGRGAS